MTVFRKEKYVAEWMQSEEISWLIFHGNMSVRFGGIPEVTDRSVRHASEPITHGPSVSMLDSHIYVLQQSKELVSCFFPHEDILNHSAHNSS